VQRISAARITAKSEGREVRDGDVVPACAAACPAEAIVFGDLSDPMSRVSRLHASDRCYSLLSELNVKPRTRYLARLRNPLPGGGGR
jgi:molybdopterin-containing oxidoreductase family iron-sulfur binding subunit